MATSPLPQSGRYFRLPNLDTPGYIAFTSATMHDLHIRRSMITAIHVEPRSPHLGIIEVVGGERFYVFGDFADLLSIAS